MKAIVAVTVAFLALSTLCTVLAQSRETGEETAAGRATEIDLLFEEYPRKRYAALNERFDGALSPLFSRFPDAYRVHEFVNDDETRTAYRQFLIAVLADARDGNVAEALFRNFVLSITPPRHVVDAIVPEIGAGGRLEGILDSPHSEVRRHIEHQAQQGYPGEPDFRYYAEYLENHNDERPKALIEHMFRTHPDKALYALMSAEYVIPYPPPGLSRGADVNRQIRPVLVSEHLVSDVIWRKRFNVPIRSKLLSDAKDALEGISRHSKWWVRLYVAEILIRHPELHTDAMMQRLKDDEHELVRQAVTRERKRKGEGKGGGKGKDRQPEGNDVKVNG